MDDEKNKLRIDLSALTRAMSALSARVETLERQAAEAKAAEAKVQAAMLQVAMEVAAAEAKAEAKAAAEAKPVRKKFGQK